MKNLAKKEHQIIQKFIINTVFMKTKEIGHPRQFNVDL